MCATNKVVGTTWNKNMLNRHIEKSGKEIHTWVISKQFVTIVVVLCFGIGFSIWVSLETNRLVDGEASERSEAKRLKQ
jgi:hypothetical protein